MSNNNPTALSTSLFTKKINCIGKKLLGNNHNYRINNNGFSMIFIADTHSEQLSESKKKYSSLEQYCLLLRKIKLYDEVICIIHGGDAIHGFANNSKKSNNQLNNFITSTKLELYEHVEPLKRIPFIMNTGNHEYCSQDKNNNSDNFNKLVGEKSDLIKTRGYYLDIILLDTGYTHNGFPDLISFKKQICSVEKKIKKEHKKVRFILDMHIPPKLGEFIKYANHTLNSQLTEEFVKFLNKYQDRVIAVTTHHIHNFDSIDSSIPVYIHPIGNIPIYLTSSGGHKDSNKHYKNKCKCLKINFNIDKNTVQLKNAEEIKL